VDKIRGLTITSAVLVMLALNVVFGYYALAEPPDYLIATDTPYLLMDPGDSASFNLTLSPLRGFDSNVILRVADAPKGVEVTFDQNATRLAGGENITIRVDVGVDEAASAGLSDVVIEANSNGLVHKLTEKLNIIGSGRVIIEIRDFWFWPDNVTIRKGTSVTWVNRDLAGHTATSYEEIWNSKLLKKNQQYTYVFNETGDYNYYCIPHPQMVGVVRVID